MFPLGHCTPSASKRVQSSASVALHQFGFYASSFSIFKCVTTLIPSELMLVLQGKEAPPHPSSSSSHTGYDMPDDTHLDGFIRKKCSCMGFLATFKSRSRRFVFCLKHQQQDCYLQHAKGLFSSENTFSQP